MLKRRARRKQLRLLSKRLKEFRNSLLAQTSKTKRKRKLKTNWEITNWWQDLQNPAIRDPTTEEGKEFRRLHRVPYPVFIDLIEKCKRYNLFGANEYHRNCIPVEIKLMAVLRILLRVARGHDDLTIKNMSKIGKSTVHNIFKSFVERFVKQFHGKWINRRPSPDELAKIMETYRKLGFPGAIGSVDCTHVGWRRCPYSLANLARGKEDSCTVAFECVVDHRRYIWSCSKGFLGSHNDQNLADADRYMEELRKGDIFADIEFEIFDEEGIKRKVTGVYLICDNGYKKHPHLICPYIYRSVKEQVYFSEYLESVRKDVECTFGILKHSIDNGALINNAQKYTIHVNININLLITLLATALDTPPCFILPADFIFLDVKNISLSKEFSVSLSSSSSASSIGLFGIFTALEGCGFTRVPGESFDKTGSSDNSMDFSPRNSNCSRHLTGIIFSSCKLFGFKTFSASEKGTVI